MSQEFWATLLVGAIVVFFTLLFIFRPRSKIVAYAVWQDAAGQWWAAKSVDGKTSRWIGPYESRAQAYSAGVPKAKMEVTR